MDLSALDRAIAGSLDADYCQRGLLNLSVLPEEVQAPSVLADRLLELATWGFISTSCVQWIASGALIDGLEHEEIKVLVDQTELSVFFNRCLD